MTQTPRREPRPDRCCSTGPCRSTSARFPPAPWWSSWWAPSAGRPWRRKTSWSVVVGEQVYADDDAKGEEHLAEVLALHHRNVQAVWILSAGGDRIETTDEHPFYVVDRGWTEAKDLHAGDTLVATGGNRLKLDKIERVEQPAKVYNFEARGLHSYLVGRVGAVVHNCKAGLRPISSREVTTYEEFVDRSVIGDKLEGHEILQHAILKREGLAAGRLSTDVSKKNIVIALEKSLHSKVKALQAAADLTKETALKNIGRNGDILLRQGIARRRVYRAVGRALEHAKSLGLLP